MQTVDGSNITLVESSEYSLLSNDTSSNTWFFCESYAQNISLIESLKQKK